MGATMNKKQAKNKAWKNMHRNPFAAFFPPPVIKAKAKPANVDKPCNVFSVSSFEACEYCEATYCCCTNNDVSLPAGKPEKTLYSASRFEEGLKKHGFIRLGSGMFSAVWAHPKSDKVIKIIKQEDCWIDYAYWANQAGYGGTLAPKVFSFKKKANYSLAVVERCAKLARQFEFKTPESVVQSLIYQVGHGNETAQTLLDLLHAGSEKFFKDLRDKFSGHRRFDFHGENIMFREDGSLCVTDPICGTSSLTSTRLKARDFTPSSSLKEYLIACSCRYRN